MIAIGLDPSSRSTGVCALRVGTDTHTRKGRTTREPDEVISCQTFRKTSGTHDWSRVLSIRQDLTEWLNALFLEVYPGDPDQMTLAVIEDYAFSAGRAGSASVHKLVEVGTALRLELDEWDIPWIVVKASELKKFAGAKAGKVGSRKTRNKAPVAAAVADLWGFVDKSDDIVDAYVLAQIGASIMERTHYRTPAQLEVATAHRPEYRALVAKETI